MNILYLHGLDATPHEGEITILEERGHQVFYKYADYRNDPEVFTATYQMAKENNVDFIVGCSMGGYYGYWLGHKLGLRQLLFNPHMPFRSVKVQQHNIEERPYVGSYVVLGAKDDTMPATFNLSFFSSRQHAKVVTCEWLGHQVDLETFKEMVQWSGL